MIRVRTPTAESTQAFAAKLAVHLRDYGPPSLVIGLGGDLGAGKTTFTQGFVAGLAPDDDIYVTSPTFAIAQIYETIPPVRHLDLYRLADLDELEAIGYRDLYFAPGFALVEWFDRVTEALPRDWMEIDLAVGPSDVREIALRAHGEAQRALRNFSYD
nr:tRNA threonylcarbamoyladenosine biosynthesis protein TsaE-like [Nerophis lumbriciformis]